MPDLDSIQQQLALLKIEFSANLVDRVDKMVASCNDLLDKPEPDTILKELFRQIHSLSGSAGTFGYHQLSEHSRQLELIVKEFVNKKALPARLIRSTQQSASRSLTP